MTEQDVIKKHSDIILKKIIQMYKLYERKHKQANKKLGNMETVMVHQGIGRLLTVLTYTAKK